MSDLEAHHPRLPLDCGNQKQTVVIQPQSKSSNSKSAPSSPTTPAQVVPIQSQISTKRQLRDEHPAQSTLVPTDCIDILRSSSPPSSGLESRIGNTGECTTSGSGQDRMYHQIVALETQIAAKKTLLSQNLEACRSLLSKQRSTYHVPPATEDMSEDELLDQARVIVQEDTKRLRNYNEIKDIGLELLGLIADTKAQTLSAVMAERGVDNDDS